MTPYRLLSYGVLPLLPLHLLWRGLRDRRYLRGWPARFGYGGSPPAVGGIWLHAVSVGEVNAAAPLIEYLATHFSAHPLYLTTTTPSGAARAAALSVPNLWHTYLPYDYPSAVSRFLDRLQPKLGILMETELWPHLLGECRRRRVPMIFANARLSARSLRGYQRASWLSTMPWEAFAHIGAQSAPDAGRLRQLGAPAGRVAIAGNLKYERQVESAALAAGQAWRKAAGTRPIWVAGSTHPGEERLLLGVFETLRERFPDLQLILAPRHPERAKRVCRMVLRAGWAVDCHAEVTAAPDVCVLDRIGQLAGFLAIADVAFIGGSLAPNGGHNLLEACAAGTPVAFGPYMHNFAEMAEEVAQSGAGAQVEADQLAAQLAAWLADPATRAGVGKQGRALVERERGALEHYAPVFKRLMG